MSQSLAAAVPSGHFHVTLSCPDRRGIVAAVASLLASLGCNIVDAQQYVDDETNVFFMRVVFSAPCSEADIRSALGPVDAELSMDWTLSETDRLKDSLRSLNDNIEEANRKKNLLLAKQRRADAAKRINETMSHISEKSAFEAFARMEEKIDANERKVRASAEIDEEFSGDRLANDFKRLEAAGGNQSAEVLLIELKQKMGVLPAGTQVNSRVLGAGRNADEETIEVEEIHDEKK